MIFATVLVMLACGQAPADNDFLGDARRIAALEKSLNEARTALDNERRATARAVARAVAAEERADRAEKLAESRLRTVNLLRAAVREAPAPAPLAPTAPAAPTVRARLMNTLGQHLGDFDIPAGSTVTGYDPTTGHIQYIPPR